MKHVEIKLTCLFDGLVRTRHIKTYLPKSEYVGFDGDVFRIGQMFTVERWRVLKVQIIDHGVIGKVRRLSEA